MRLKDKVAIVTGAAPQAEGVGNGSAAAILYAREGAKVVLVNRSEARAHKLKREIDAAGGECIVCVADVAQEDDVKRMVATTVERHGRIDVLHNNVGGNKGGGRVTELDESLWDATMKLNLNSAMLCCKHVIPHMIAQGGGSIVNVSSLAGMIGLFDRKTSLVAYSTAKAGLSGFTRALAADHAADGIRVNCIVVGMVETPLIVALQGPDVLEKRRAAIPLRTAGTAWDVAHAAVYLASDESRWVTGIDLPIDGGQMRLFERPR
ncbi:MAG TPA: SDR family NAD(P)-dependent oxidoreductase [Burkholderiales bacterium]|nr:SDR family NAD(P)-dependent oxidoreductase [Burkholderiales bacterium]